MKWIPLTTEAQLKALIERSHQVPQLIFKYSSRCSISDMVQGRLEKNKAPEGIDFHFLDLIRYRELSNRIASQFDVHHESPQVLLIRNGECMYNESHGSIRMDDIVLQVMEAL